MKPATPVATSHSQTVNIGRRRLFLPPLRMLIVLIVCGWGPRQTRGLEAYVEVEVRQLRPVWLRPVWGFVVCFELTWFEACFVVEHCVAAAFVD